MISRRTLIPVVLLLVLLSQLWPGAALTPRSANAATYCDWAQFIADVTVPDGTTFSPGATFTKTWRVKNIGTCTWTTSYAFVFVSGSQMGAPAVVNLTSSVAPGQTVDLTVNMTAPTSTGHYRGYWKMRNASGVLFGLGSGANSNWWVDINVATTYGTVYDFVANYCSATWTSSAGLLSCPGTDGDTRGFVLKLNSPRLENGVTDTQPGLITHPQKVTDGYIQGIFPEFAVQSGDRFQSIVNCEYGSTGCYVTFRLDYQVGSGPIKTIWTFREKIEGLYYRANISLGSLAGQNVKFILTILASGSATGDRALWGAPRIVRSGASVTFTPTSTGTVPTHTATPTGTLPTPTKTSTQCDRASFVADVTVPDGTTFTPGATFLKTWRLKNTGNCTWTTDYKLAFVSGDALGASTLVNLPSSVAPGQTADLSVNMTAPSSAGHYKGFWKLKNSSGTLFGLGASGATSFWVEINVSGTTGMIYDFYANACAATWKSAAGTLPCPGTDGSANGFVLKLPTVTLEDGTSGQFGLLTFPQKITDGHIRGIYPAFTVQSGDHFQTIVNCERNAINCYVTFRLEYRIGDGQFNTLWTFREKYEGMYYRADINLSALAGKTVQFALTVYAYGSPSGDRAVWVAPRITRTGASSAATSLASPTATATVTATTTSSTSSWVTYQNTKYAFNIRIPPGSTITDTTDIHARINLPFAQGTNLTSKFIDITVVEGTNPCVTPIQGANPQTQTETFNGISFLVQTGSDGSAGHLNEWTAYSTLRNNACISLAFVLRSANLGNYSSPPPAFDKAAESTVFATIMSTFGWLNP